MLGTSALEVTLSTKLIKLNHRVISLINAAPLFHQKLTRPLLVRQSVCCLGKPTRKQIT